MLYLKLLKKVIFAFAFLILFSITKGYSADAILLNHKTTITVDHGRLNKKIHNEILILNRDGDYYSEISIPHSSLIKSSKIKAYLADEKGKTIRKLKQKEIITRSSISDYSLFEDHYVQEFTLKHNSYPYKIVYSYELDYDQFISLTYWQPVLNTQVSTLNASLEIRVPSSYPIDFIEHSTSNFTEKNSGDQTIYSWNANYDGKLKEEIYSPTLDDLLPTVRAVPKEFEYEIKGSLESWKTYGDWQAKLINGLSDLPESEKEKARRITENILDQKEKIRALFHYLQDNTRYVNVSIETGGLKPYPASYVCTNKYGDCKALSIYFKSLLEAVGITSHYAKIKAGEQISPIVESFPSQQSNHIILFIPLDNDTLWIDCTSKFAFNYLGTFTQNRNALIIENGNSHLVKTPSLTPEDVLEKRVVTIKPEGYLGAAVDFKNTYAGDAYESLYSLSKNYNENKKSLIIRNYIIDYEFDLRDSRIEESHRDSGFVNFSYSAGTKKIYQKYGNEMIINPLAFLLPDFEEPKKRKHSVQIDYPIHMIDSLTFKIPDDYTLSYSETDTLKSDYGYYHRSIIAKDSILFIEKKFVLKSGSISRKDYAKFYSFMRDVRKTEYNNRLILSRKETSQAL